MTPALYGEISAIVPSMAIRACSLMLKGPGFTVNPEPPTKGTQEGISKSPIGRTHSRILPKGHAIKLQAKDKVGPIRM